MINTHNVLKLSQTLKSGLFCLLTNATRLTVARKWSDQHFPTNRPLLWSQLPPVFFPGFSVSFSKISTISHQKLSRNVLKLWVCKEHRDCVCSVWCIVHRVRILRRFRIDWQKSCDIWPSAGKTTLLSISTYHQNCLWLPPKRAPHVKGITRVSSSTGHGLQGYQLAGSYWWSVIIIQLVDDSCYQF